MKKLYDVGSKIFLLFAVHLLFFFFLGDLIEASAVAPFYINYLIIRLGVRINHAKLISVLFPRNRDKSSVWAGRPISRYGQVSVSVWRKIEIYGYYSGYRISQQTKHRPTCTNVWQTKEIKGYLDYGIDR